MRKLVTAHAASKSSGENWVTINGVHVCLDKNGKISKGPAKFIGSTLNDLPGGSNTGKYASKKTATSGSSNSTSSTKKTTSSGGTLKSPDPRNTNMTEVVDNRRQRKGLGANGLKGRVPTETDKSATSKTSGTTKKTETQRDSYTKNVGVGTSNHPNAKIAESKSATKSTTSKTSGSTKKTTTTSKAKTATEKKSTSSGSVSNRIQKNADSLAKTMEELGFSKSEAAKAGNFFRDNASKGMSGFEYSPFTGDFKATLKDGSVKTLKINK